MFFCHLQSVQCQTPWFDLQDFFFIPFFIGILAEHQCNVFCLKTQKRANNITFETITYVKVLSLVKLKQVRIQSHSSYHKHLIESFETINSVKTGFHHLRSFSVPPVNLKMKGNSYNNIVNSISILITTVLLQALKKII